MLSAIAFAALAGLSGLAILPSPALAGPPSQHLGGGATTDTCASCRRIHTEENDWLLEGAPQRTLCFTSRAAGLTEGARHP